MKYELIHDEQASRLILIFSGWGTDPAFYSHIKHPGYDVMVAYDYSDLSFPTEVLKKYHTICLFAWSLGVYAAEISLPADLISLAVAINGTTSPVSDENGIPVSIFQGTIDGLDERNLMKFRRRMAGKAYDSIKDKLPGLPIENLRKQLETIRDSKSSEKSIRWNRAYISEQDAIFPPRNQRNAWQRHESAPEIISLDSYHYVDLLPIVEGIVPSNEAVGKNFERARTTYDDNASAQKRIATRLLESIPALDIAEAIEIGPGSGFFSAMFAKRFQPKLMEYVDLYPIPAMQLTPSEIYHTKDGEDWLRNQILLGRKGTCDAIVSSSAIQWFVNPHDFFSNAATLLKSGGILACSTFLPGNMSELDMVNPFRLVYRSEEELRRYLETRFSKVTMFSEEMTIEFETPRDVVRHIHHTGVGGSAKSGLPLSRLLSVLPLCLTYRPLYIIAIK